MAAPFFSDKLFRSTKTTDYQIFTPTSEKIVDFTAKRLKKLLEVSNSADRIVITIILEDYKKGCVAVGWSRGKPVWVKVKSETR